MTIIAIGSGAGHTSLELPRQLTAAWRRLLRRIRAWRRLYRRRASLIRALATLTARDRADIGLPIPRPLQGLEYMARMFMMR